MSSNLDRDARKLIRLAKLAERDLPRDKALVRRRLMHALGAGVATGAATAAAEGTALASAAGKSALPLASAAGKSALPLAAASTGAASLKAVSSGTLLGSALKVIAVLATGSVAALTVRELAPQGDASMHAPPAVRKSAADRVSRAADPPGSQHTETSRSSAARSARSAAPAISARDKEAPSRPAALGRAPAQQAVRTRETEARAPTPGARGAAPDARSLPPAASSGGPSPLARDLRTLREAQAALNAGAPAQALELLGKLRGRQLLAEKTALEVFALCALGRRDEARVKADAFRALAPGSPLLPRVDASCAKL